MDSKERYQKLKEQGICVWCRKEKAVENQVFCENCKEKRREKRRENSRKYEKSKERYQKEKQYHKERYQKFKEQGICVMCKEEKAVENQVFCEKCREKHRQQKKEDYEWYKAHGICTECRKEKAFGNKTLCAGCIEKKTLENIKRYSENREDMLRKIKKAYKKRYSERKARGICVNCGKREAETGKVLCTRCNTAKKQKRLEYYYKKLCDENTVKRSDRVSLGLCFICGKPLNNHDSLCDECFKTAEIRMKKIHKNPTEKMKVQREEIKKYWFGNGKNIKGA